MRRFLIYDLDLSGKTTAMDGGSVAIGREPMRPTAMDGGSAGAAGSGSSKNLEGLHIGMFLRIKKFLCFSSCLGDDFL
jgi:hypothetical protein